jgi:membrane protease YdiL (CAAX protease family)
LVNFMERSVRHPRAAGPVRFVTVWSAALTLTWAAVWVAYERLARGPLPGLRGFTAATAWWLAAKLVVWIAPVVAFVRWRHGPAAAAWLGLARATGLLRGLGIAAGWVAVSALAGRLLPGQWPTPVAPSEIATHLFLVCVGPFLEELVYRGFVLRTLVDGGLGFWRANALTAVLFALLHVPGWLFMGRSPAACARELPLIALTGFVFGAARARGGSLWASVVVHVANNAWSSGLLLGIARAIAGHLS